ncbi:MAG TPA: signal peptidase II [Gemmatimonas sp.]|nr:signal peptidase II [Gemmatimonas sp.]
MKVFVTWPLLLFVVLLDVVTKRLAESMLPGVGLARPFIGDTVRFALVYNPGAAFGLYLGSYSRWIFMVLTAGALIILWRLYRQTLQGDLTRAVAIALVAAGAIGNLIDRLRNELGVVDFIDVGFGDHRWPTFNIADMAVSGGAFLLAYVLWNEERAMTADGAPLDATADKRTDAREVS